MRAVVHEDEQAELPRADHHDGEHDGDWVRKIGDQCHRAEDHRPGVRDERQAFPFNPLAQEREVGGGDQIPRRKAAGHRSGGFHEGLL